MKLPKELTKVTSFSKTVAIILFILLPIVGFLLGIRYQEMMDLSKRQMMEQNIAVKRIPTPTPIAIPTIDPSITVNWKMYKSSNYTIKYPSNFTLDIKDPKKVVFSFPKSSESPTPFPTDYCCDAIHQSEIIISQSQVPKGTSIFEAAKGLYDTYPSQTVIVDGLVGLYFPNVPALHGLANVYVIKDNTLYVFSISEGNDKSQIGDFSKQKLLFQQILATFKLTP